MCSCRDGDGEEIYCARELKPLKFTFSAFRSRFVFAKKCCEVCALFVQVREVFGTTSLPLEHASLPRGDERLAYRMQCAIKLNLHQECCFSSFPRTNHISSSTVAARSTNTHPRPSTAQREHAMIYESRKKNHFSFTRN